MSEEPREEEALAGAVAEALAWLRWEAEVSAGFGLPPVPPESVASDASAAPREPGPSETPSAVASHPPQAPAEEARRRAEPPVAASPRSAPASGAEARAGALPEMPEPLQRVLFGEPTRPRPQAPPPPRPAFEPPPQAPAPSGLPLPERERRLAELREQVAGCTACRLHEGRSRTVFARGSLRATVVFVGEGPGFHEDQQGLPFVGPAGQLLDRMIAAMGLGEDEFYICNVVKCRPPGNRTPLPEEVAACLPFLEGQLRAIGPRVIVALGRPATEALGCMPASGRGWRGRWGAWEGIPVMPTYHPAFLLRTPARKRDVWNDLKAVLQRLGREPPPRGGAGR